MIKLLTIIGARPQIIKASAISRAIKRNFSSAINEIICHTGQHYDFNMSEVFFKQLEIPAPDINLEVGSASHGQQTAKMLSGIENTILENKSDALLLYGDTNSTLAGTIVASKMNIPVIHVEAGLRSFKKKMPEEINRIICDHASTLLFSPTQNAINNLIKEGFKYNNPPYSIDNPGIFHCGDVMYDNSLFFSDKADSETKIIYNLELNQTDFLLCTIHRDANTDNLDRLNTILEILINIVEKYSTKIVFPVHPRTRKQINYLGTEIRTKLFSNTKIKLIDPVSFFEMIVLEKNCKLVLTDSGGVQKEAYFFNKPVIILRPETEWVEIVNSGAGIITDFEKEKILSAISYFFLNKNLRFPKIFGDGNAADFICRKIVELF